MRLYRFERRWFAIAFETILPSRANAKLTLGARDVPLDRFLDDLFAVGPLRMLAGFRLALWVVTLAPLFVLGRWRLFAQLDLRHCLAVRRADRRPHPRLRQGVHMTMRCLIAAAFALLHSGSVEANPRPRPGDQAPAFSLPASDGKTIALADYRNKKTVVLAFFPKAFTGG